jgi:hypothetical protein
LAIEVPVLEVFDGDGFLTKIGLCHLTDNPKRSHRSKPQLDLALSMLQSLSKEVVVKREIFSLL